MAKPPREAGGFQDRKWKEQLSNRVENLAAFTQAAFVTLEPTPEFLNERTLAGSGTVQVTDNGAGSSVVLDVIPGGIALSGLSGTLPISKGGTGQTTADAALNALLPTQTGNAGKVLQTDGSTTSWQTASGGSGSISAGQGTVDFGTGADSASVAISDTGVTLGSKFTLGLRVASGRDPDELELSPLTAYVSSLSAGVSVTVSVACLHPDDFADGQFLVDYMRS